MIRTSRNPVVLTQDDYQLLKPFVRNDHPAADPYSLSHELDRAIVIRNEAFPSHTVRINSRVSVEDLDTGRTLSFRLVMPAYADMRQNKVSILTPIGAALIGFRSGETVEWQVPGGLKRFRILKVINGETAEPAAAEAS